MIGEPINTGMVEAVERVKTARPGMTTWLHCGSDGFTPRTTPPTDGTAILVCKHGKPHVRVAFLGRSAMPGCYCETQEATANIN